jgi:hypothetical protein
MQHIQGISRNQLQMVSLEDKISTDNPVRFIDAFVSFIDLKKVGFEPKTLKTPFKNQTHSLEHTFQEKALVFYEKDEFEAVFSPFEFSNK